MIFIYLILSKESKADNYPNSFSFGQFYFLMDADTGEILLSKNADIPLPPSSMTKLMTAYVVFDQIKNGTTHFDEKCSISKDAWGKSGSSMFLNYGDVVSVEDLLKGLLAVSANDASIALAINIAGSVENFTRLMNLQVVKLGMKNSHFKNPHGLHEENHYSSVHDLAILINRLYKDFPQYSHYLGIPEFTYRNITQKNRNPLIRNNYDGVIGGKTGHTNQGGYGIASIVKRDNRRLIAVVNKLDTPKQREELVTDLLDYGFARYKKINLFSKGDEVLKVRTWLGNKSEISLSASEDIAFNILAEKSLDDINANIRYKSPIYAPILKGDKIGTLVIEIKDSRRLEYDLTAKEKVDKVGFIRKIFHLLKYKIQKFF